MHGTLTNSRIASSRRRDTTQCAVSAPNLDDVGIRKKWGDPGAALCTLYTGIRRSGTGSVFMYALGQILASR